MNKAIGSTATHEQIAARTKKAPYLRPTLRCFGSVSTLTMGNNGSNADKDNTTKKGGGASDRGIKERLVRVGDHPLGIGLYLFDFKPGYRDECGCGRQFGVMADEVERVMPEAVSMHADGYKQVNYAMLGISRTLH